MKTYTLIGLLILITSCIQEPENNGLGGFVDDEKEYNEVMTNDSTDAVIETEEDTITLEQFTDLLIDILNDNDLEQFAQYFHPEKGTYFVPYTYLDTTKAIHYNTSDFINDLKNNTSIIWGEYDGSGETIKLSIKDYFKQFVYNVDYKTLTTRKNINSKLPDGNAINNINDIFPNTEYVDYYYKGSGNYEGMDWSSLTFYAEKFDGKYYLLAVVHNQWTI